MEASYLPSRCPAYKYIWYFDSSIHRIGRCHLFTDLHIYINIFIYIKQSICGVAKNFPQSIWISIPWNLRRPSEPKCYWVYWTLDIWWFPSLYFSLYHIHLVCEWRFESHPTKETKWAIYRYKQTIFHFAYDGTIYTL